MKAQEYLNQHYPREERKNIKKLNLKNKRLTGYLDLSDFTNLEELNCLNYSIPVSSPNQIMVYNLSNIHLYHQAISEEYGITNLNISSCNKLKYVNLSGNKIDADLSIFSHLTDLYFLDLGWSELKEGTKNNSFRGSLKALENCKKLEHLCVGYQHFIWQGLEYLPLDSLKFFGCYGTSLQSKLRPFDYDIETWKLVNHPHLVINKYFDEEDWNSVWSGELYTRWDQSHKILQEQPNNKVKRIQRLCNKIKILDKEREKLQNKIETQYEFSTTEQY